MAGRFRRSWALAGMALGLIRRDRSLLVFPLLSGAAALLVIASFVLPLMNEGRLAAWAEQPEAAAYGWMFLFYVAMYFVTLFFNTALASVALLHLSGTPATWRDGLARASSRLPAIFGYAVLAATVGTLLRMLEERLGWIGRAVTAVLGVTWTVVTFLVVPVLAAEGKGPVDTLKESGRLLRTTWGENLIGQGGIGAVVTLAYLLVGLLGIIGLVVAESVAGSAGLIIALVILVAAMVTLAVVHAAMSGTYAAALYVYATRQEAPPGVPAGLMAEAFAPKKQG